jgi:hypothetical protein
MLRQTVGHRAPSLMYPSFFPSYCDFPKLSVILLPLYWTCPYPLNSKMSASNRCAEEVARLGQQAVCIKASVISWNQSKLIDRIKMNSRFSNTDIRRRTCTYQLKAFSVVSCKRIDLWFSTFLLSQKIFPLTSVSRPALGPTQPPVQWVPGVLSRGVNRGRGVTLTTHPHLMSRSWMSRSYTSSPLKRLHGV